MAVLRRVVLLTSTLQSSHSISYFLQFPPPASSKAPSFSNNPKPPINKSQPLSSSPTELFNRNNKNNLPSPSFETNPTKPNLLSPLSKLLQRYGFPQSHLSDFLEKNRFLLHCSSLEHAQRSLDLLLSLGYSQKSLISVLFACPSVLKSKNFKKMEFCLSGFVGFSNSEAITKGILEYSAKFGIELDNLHDNQEFLRFYGVNEFSIPRLLEQSPWLMFLDRKSELEPNLQILKNLGVRDETVSMILEEFLAVVLIGTEELIRKFEFFKKSGFSRNEIDRVCYEFPAVLGMGVEDRLDPLVGEIESLSFGGNKLKKTVMDDPRVFSMEVGELSRCVGLLKNLKCRLPIKEEILCKGIIKASMGVKLRIDCLYKHGLTYREAFKLLQWEPRLIVYEIEDIEKKIDFLLNTMGFPISCVLEVPEYLGVNFEKQIVPRYRVIEYLRSKGGLGFEVGLRGLIKPSRHRFYNLYVKPYSECQEIFGNLSRDIPVRTRCPTGLWKLFKPNGYPESEEDSRNMRSFMESLV